MRSATTFSGIQMNWFAVLAGLFCLTMAAAASAEQNAKPCADDAAKLCKGVQPGEGRMARCLKEHADEVSPACKANIGKAKKNVQKLAEVCRADREKLCKDTKPGGGRVMRCLKQHEGELSAACKDELARPKKLQK